MYYVVGVQVNLKDYPAYFDITCKQFDHHLKW